jgi:hypothetical protein
MGLNFLKKSITKKRVKVKKNHELPAVQIGSLEPICKLL